VYGIDNDNPNLPKVYVYVYKLTEPVQKRRPTRKNVPRYKSTAMMSDTVVKNGLNLSRFVNILINYFPLIHIAVSLTRCDTRHTH
jgi:hypothetical protein